MKTLLAALLLLMSAAVFAQTTPVLTFTAGTTTGSSSVVPVLTWATTPAAASCAASGDAAWTGTKAAAGTQTLVAITASKTYNLSCTWNDQRITVKWTPATVNTDGTPYTDPKSVKVFFGTVQPLTTFVTVPATAAPQSVIGPLVAGTWLFTAKSVNQSDAESDPTPVLTKVVAATSATRTVGITVNPVPLPPSNFTVE